MLNVTDWGYPSYWWGYYGPGGTTVSQYTEGTIFVDLIDAKTNQVVCRRTASPVAPHSPRRISLAGAQSASIRGGGIMTRKTNVKWGASEIELCGDEVKVGQKAPDFEVVGQDFKPITLKDT